MDHFFKIIAGNFITSFPEETNIFLRRKTISEQKKKVEWT